MGHIHDEVRKEHLKDYPDEQEILKSFLANFDVTWAARRRSSNTTLSVYLLTPDGATRQAFGLEREVVLFISDFSTVQARTMQAADQILTTHPIHGRIEQGFYFLVTPDPNAASWVDDYSIQYPQARAVVVLDRDAVRGAAGDAWFIRNALTRQLFSRDLFDYQLPVDTDLGFFGRDGIVTDLLDAIKQSQNLGLFGLRKTGKTSILFKVKRIFEHEERGLLLYYDCKLPEIRMLRWHEVLARVIVDVATFYGQPQPTKKQLRPTEVSATLRQTLTRTPSGKTTALVFDEIEYISPLSTLDKHWHADFTPLWQTLWGVQSQFRRLSSTISGLNASLAEQNEINNVQNPMFGIVKQRYLRGFDVEETKQMLKSLGRRMGLKFSIDAIEYLQSQYGGHPLLTRMACSQENKTLLARRAQRPASLDAADLKTTQQVRDDELSFYCVHVLSVLKDFYPEEYELVRVLELDGAAAFHERARLNGASVKHLEAYGLLEKDRPVLAMPVVGAFMKREHMRTTGTAVPRRPIPESVRPVWTKARLESISRSVRDLDRIIDAKAMPVALYGVNSYPFAEEFLVQRPVSTKAEFVEFANVLNKCLVEPLDNAGKKSGKEHYFWKDVVAAFPDYWEGLLRVKIYRHMVMHAKLDPGVENHLARLLKIDLGGQLPNDVPDGWFFLQHAVLDSLFLGVQYELVRYS